MKYKIDKSDELKDLLDRRLDLSDGRLSKLLKGSVWKDIWDDLFGPLDEQLWNQLDRTLRRHLMIRLL